LAFTKRKTVKTGPYSKRTITQSSKGTRITTSSKPPGAATRRTVSTNLKTGSQRTTHTTKLGGGWFKTTSKTRTPVKRVRSSRSRSYSSGGGESISFLDLLILPFLPIIWTYNLIKFTFNLVMSPWFWFVLVGFILILAIGGA
jgi:hypothetical protein